MFHRERFAYFESRSCSSASRKLLAVEGFEKQSMATDMHMTFRNFPMSRRNLSPFNIKRPPSLETAENAEADFDILRETAA